ncbi:MAG: F0F1 ATP synthase subunit B [Bacteroidales bacterium]
MELIQPDFGLLFWMIVSFGILLLILKKYAWKPILAALKERERTIQERLDIARKAKKELAEIEFGNERIIALAKTERANIIKEAQQKKNAIIEEARKEAKKEADKIIEETHKKIEHQKEEAMEEIKNQISIVSVDIAEKILKQKLSGDKEQREYIKELVNKVEIN